MKVIFERKHTVRPADYEAVSLIARLEIDSDNEEDAAYFEGDLRDTGDMLSQDIDALLDADVDRTLRLDGNTIEESHLWSFYGRD